MREKERRGNVTILLPHLCFKVAPCSSCSESHILCFKVAPCFSYSESNKLSCLYQWEFFIIELGLYIPMMGFLKMPQVFVSKRVGCTPTSFLLLSIHSSSASAAWQSLLLMLTSIDGHLHSPLIILVNVRLSPFLSSPQNPHHHILFHLQCYIHGSRSCIA